jgi:hypothetical protein
VAVRIKSDKRCEVLLRISKLSFQDELKSWVPLPHFLPLLCTLPT